ncbi:MAG: J domain-containing protein [Geminicoccaceae bacterium]
MEQKRNREQERQEALRLNQSRGKGAPWRCCARTGCDAEGVYRAPLARDRLREFQWLCLDHVREFNRGWDYFAGMSQHDIDAHRRADVTWHRPTWRMGAAFGPTSAWHDLFGLLGEQDAPPPPRRPRSKAEEMMDRLGLAAGFTLIELKQRYKALAKQHHPDLHGGDKAAEERLKLINEAYTYLNEQRLFA